MKNILYPLLFSTVICCAIAADGTNSDNTAVNQRDKSGETKTSFDQSEKPIDVQLTAKIRQLVVKDATLSALAKNVKIISSNGEVVLRGPVKSTAEKDLIAGYAKSAGATKVTNQLELK